MNRCWLMRRSCWTLACLDMCAKCEIKLTCGYCGQSFEGTKSQISNAKYLNTQPYCSRSCRSADISRRRKEKPVFKGNCKECGKAFESKHPKIYCSMECFAHSDDMKLHLAANNEKKKNEVAVKCLHCSKAFVEKASRKSKFCSRFCYRSYLAERFDRWIASPENIENLQNYDEFLLQEKLPCLIDGCDWEGKNLSMHLNFHHGITAGEFKKLAGFNKKTGLVSPSLSEHLSNREHLQDKELMAHRMLAFKYRGEPTERELRKEGREHHKKSRILSGPGPSRTCGCCGKTFTQTTVFGLAKYCSPKCQQETHIAKNAAKKHDMTCGHCKKHFFGNRYQQIRVERELPVFCSFKCRGIEMGGRPKKVLPK